MGKARRLMERIAWKITMRRSRRTVRASKGRYLDLRRTLRVNMKYGGEIIELRARATLRKRRRSSLICDISGSMDRYSRLLLQFVHTMEQGLDRVEVFVFGTRLTRITRQLRVRNIDSALERVLEGSAGLGGRHAHRRVALHLQHPLGAARARSGRARADHQRRLGSRRCRGARKEMARLQRSSAA